MDFGSIATVIASLRSAQELAAATLGVRDFNQSAAAIAQINEKLLAAQQGLLMHNAALLQLQQEHFETAKELRELKEATASQMRYPLVDLGGGKFVYRVEIAPHESRPGEPGSTEASHYLCQPCWDTKGHRSVLQYWGSGWHCTLCRQAYIPNGPVRRSLGLTGYRLDDL
ncbi:hypothetical protein QY702_04545 [Xanthomonas campestris pv. plantaginis]|uniref:hypothetical protein n=1 Tax=Xanthomonas campestris TaxID=339 RepID=UPI002B2299CB|nr:hypothetical protein [Xanthomonas campestris]MEA9605737.1 hypothetical protein [Xanthomonas campestris pv. plantaginis]